MIAGNIAIREAYLSVELVIEPNEEPTMRHLPGVLRWEYLHPLVAWYIPGVLR